MTTDNLYFVRDVMGATVFVLGASDPEMAACEAAIRAVGEAYGVEPYILYAAFIGKDSDVPVRCHGGVAYKATHLLDGDEVISPSDVDGLCGYADVVPWCDQDGWQPVWLECEVAGGDRRSIHATVLDHHREGDPGYGATPDKFWEASTIGQLWRWLIAGGCDPVIADRAFGGIDRAKLVAASDHCPGHAFLGLCPGVDVEALKRFRAANSAAFNQMEPEVWLQTVEANIEKLKGFPTATLAGTTYAIAQEDLELGNHAQLISGIPMEYTMGGSPRDPRVKVGLLGGIDPEFVRAWMESKAGVLVDIYGDPARGYAGGYLPS